MLMKITTGIDRCGIKKRKILQAFGKLCRLRHPGGAHKDWDDLNLAVQRRLDLEADEVGLVIYSSTAASPGAEPALADNDQQDVTPNNRFMNMVAKVLAERNVVNVHEDRVLAIMGGKAIANAACHNIGIGTPV